MLASTGKKGTKAKPMDSQSPRLEEGVDVMKLLADTIKPMMEQFAGINQQLVTLNQNFASQQLQLAETAKKMEQMVEVVKEMCATNKNMKKKMGQLVNKQETCLLRLQMEKANMVLRFQGVPKSAKEDMKKILSEIIAPATDLKAEEITHDMETAYRVYCDYTKKISLPGEIMVRFSRRQTRDAILKATSATPLKLGNTTIKTLKDIPFEIRQKRKNYKDLILFLQTNQILYSWVVPEGVIFKINNEREKIDSIFKAKIFLKRHLGSKEEEETGSSGSIPSETDEDLAAEEGAATIKSSYAFRDRKPR